VKSLYRISTFNLLVFLFFLAGGIIFFYSGTSTFQISKKSAILDNSLALLSSKSEQTRTGILSGRKCANAARRPLGVMLSGDTIARPLSGMQSADMVIEMPVIVADITRYLALFQCQEPEEIGSIRSARGPFIGVAKGYGAIFAHWGGEHKALNQLRDGVINNLDALDLDHTFWRKPGIPMPHDGFSSYQRLWQAAERGGYTLSTRQEPFFAFEDKKPCQDCETHVITIGYPGKFQVSYQYNPQQNAYLRFKGGTPERDALTKSQVQVKNVLVLWASIYHTYSQYDTVELDGKEGKLQAFIGGTSFFGTWRKEGFSKPLVFFNSQGKPLSFLPGNIWVQILGLDQNVQVTPLHL